MSVTRLPFTVYEFRPLPGFFAGSFTRFADGSFLADDGSYDLAFIGLSVLGAPLVLYVSLPYRANIRWRWTSRGWMFDEPLHKGGNPWHYKVEPAGAGLGDGWDRESHPNQVAGRKSMDWQVSVGGASNGAHVEFELSDPHVLAGLVRVRGGATVTPPDRPECIYCGRASWERK